MSSPSSSSDSSESTGLIGDGVISGEEVGVLSNADRVRERALGKSFSRIGPSGLLNNVLQTLPTAVRKVCKNVASMGFINAPANTFNSTDPGTLHAFFQTDVTARTARMCVDPLNDEAE